MSNFKDLPPDRILSGIACACTAFFLFTLMLALAKLMTGRVHVLEITFYRNLIPAIIIFGVILVRKKTHLLKPQMPKTLTLRVIVGNIAMLLTFAAMEKLPMANATVLFFASTLMIPVAAHFFLKEHIGLHRWVAVAIGLTGVIIIAQPTAEMTAIGVALALGAASGHAFIQIILRHMKIENSLTLTFYFLSGGALLMGIGMPWVASIPTLYDATLLLIIGIIGGIGQYFITLSFKRAPASIINPFNYTGLIWSVTFDILIWGYIPIWHVYAGAAIIIASYLFILAREKT